MIYGIADLHMDHTGQKPMDIFGEKWLDHENNIMNTWKEIVKANDLVLLPGDISWALKIDGVIGDLERIDMLPGKKVMIKGNHDYWWASLSKLNALNLKSMFFLQNNSYIHGNYKIVGTRGWISRDSDSFNENDEKVFQRELLRFKMSLESGKNARETIAIIHYPPFNIDGSTNEFVDIMKDYGVKTCLYGHLHADGHKYVVEGNISGIEFHCVASDFIDFKPKLIVEE